MATATLAPQSFEVAHALGARIRFARLARGMRQLDVDDRADVGGQSVISDLETGRARDVTMGKVVRIAAALSVPVWWLADLAEPDSVPPPTKVRVPTHRELAEVWAGRVRAARHWRGVTQRELAAGGVVSLRGIAAIESGEYPPQIGTVSRIARALDIPPAWLFDHPDETPPWDA